MNAITRKLLPSNRSTVRVINQSFWTLVAGALVLLCLGGTAAGGAVVLTFDDLPGDKTNIPTGYGGFEWENFYCLDAVNYDTNPSGYLNGMVSPNNVALNGWANPAAMVITSAQEFDFNGAYLTAAWRTGLNIDVTGYREGVPVYPTQTVVVDCLSPTWFPFNYTDIDELRFSSYGGVDYPPYSGAGEHFAMDNFTFDMASPPGLVNPGFEEGLTGWTTSTTPGGQITVVQEHTGDEPGEDWAPPEGSHFALLKTDGPGSLQQLDQAFGADAGDVLEFFYFFDARDYLPYNDYAKGVLVDLGTSAEEELFYVDIAGVGNHGSTPWTSVSHTFAASGSYELRFEISNGVDSAFDSYLGVDVPEPATTALLILGGLAVIRRRRRAC